MFGFIKTPKEPLADVKSAERWLASFAAHDPLAKHGELLVELTRIAERNARRTPSGLEALFLADASARELRRVLTAQYVAHASRSGKIEAQLWQALFDLKQRFAVAYAAFARDLIEHPQDGKWQVLMPELIARQLMQLTVDARIRMFRYEQWIPGKWAELHGLFALACSRQVERRQIVLTADEGTTTIEHQYLVTLVMHLINAGNLSPAYLDWIVRQLEKWCAPLRLTLEPAGVSSFYLDLGHRGGLRRRTPSPLEGRVLFLDTRPLVTRLQAHVIAIEQKIKRQPLSSRTARRVEQLGILTKLATQLDSEFRPLPRRGERSSAAGRVDAIVGFTRISGYLREEGRIPIPELDTGSSFGGTLEIAVFGHVRNQRDRRGELARRRLASYAVPGGQWELRDASQTGLRLIGPINTANGVTLGMLAAIRAQGDLVWTLGVVRRMKRLTVERAEIGLQIIADTVVGIDLMSERATSDPAYVVDGETATRNGAPFRALFLALRQRQQESAVQSVILPAAEYDPTKRFHLQTSKASYPVRFGRLLEQQPDWVWVAVEPLKLDHPRTRGVAAPAV